MNKIDKHLYKALKFLSTKSMKEISKMKNNSPKKYSRYIPILIEESLERSRYIEEPLDEEYSIVTGRGLNQLRALESTRRKEISLFISILAIIISLFALSKSFGLL